MVQGTNLCPGADKGDGQRHMAAAVIRSTPIDVIDALRNSDAL